MIFEDAGNEEGKVTQKPPTSAEEEEKIDGEKEERSKGEHLIC